MILHVSVADAAPFKVVVFPFMSIYGWNREVGADLFTVISHLLLYSFSVYLFQQYFGFVVGALPDSVANAAAWTEDMICL